jgi:hypothetical protein
VSKRLRAFLALALVLGVAVLAAALLGGSSSSPAAREGSEHQGLAFQKHMEDLPGIADREGPASYADQVIELNAYPSDAITADEIAGAQAAGASLASRGGVGKGKNSTTSWYSLGPTDAVYPAFLNRHGSRYVTSGRNTALAIAPSCTPADCTIWLAAAGGGVWRTNKGLSGNANWVNVSDGSFASGAIGALTYDAAHHTLYAGTGELAAAGDAEAGVGVYKSTDGGDHWTPLAGNANFFNRAIKQITIDPNDPTGNTIYVADGRGVHGIASTTAGAVSFIPGGPGVGVWKSTDGGATFTLLASQLVNAAYPNPPAPGQSFPSSFGSTRGATKIMVDPTHAGVLYAAAYNVGIWRSTDNGATWTNIHPCAVDPLVTGPAGNPFIGTCGAAADRSEIALATTPDGHTRMYQTEGDSGPPTDANGHVLGDQRYSRLFIANAVESGSPTFVDKTSAGLTFHTDAGGNIVANPSSPNYATYNFCTGQCWYDQGVVSPPGHPDLLYVFGSYVYGEAGNVSNARALLLSTDGGNTFTDLTEDSTPNAPNGLHPDQHTLVVNPSDPLQYWEGSDGGIMRSDGDYADSSSRCDSRGLSNTFGALDRCHQLLSRVPGQLTSLNSGLSTLQFQSLSVNPADSKNIQGGTQDNGTFETQGSSVVWPQTIFGDGGLSGFDATDRSFRFHTYFAQQVDVSFDNGKPPSWDWISDPLFAESSLFYFPIITDPVVHGTMYAGLQHVWRTLDDGGPQAYLDSNCNEFTGAFAKDTVCGDWVQLGTPGPAGRLTCNSAAPATPTCPYGNGRTGGNVSWVARAPANASPANANTLWAATTTGRVFISSNANAADQASVTFKRLDATPNPPAAPDKPTPDTLTPNAPNRAVSSIYVDPANPNHAWLSYLGYNASTPTLPGHVFSVTYNPGTGTATWTSLDGAGVTTLGDLPINGVVADTNGDLYAAHDFGVAKLAHGTTTWTTAAAGLPIVTVAGLTINPGARQLLAATHGRGAFQLTLP